MNNTYKAAIVGASGYTGSEIARILTNHPLVTIAQITSETHAGSFFSDLHPQFKGIIDQILISADDLDISSVDIIFLALPHGVSMKYARLWYKKAKIIDLSGDFRLSNAEVYRQWYQKEHTFEEAFREAVYGMPELHTEKIASADLVANPGCYPTASILALAPLMGSAWIQKDSVIIDAKSGTTGAGVKASQGTHFSNVNENFKAYGIANHRHTIEIEEQLCLPQAGSGMVQFTPHLLPVDRGILATAYATLSVSASSADIAEVYRSFYAAHPFVRVRDTAPSIKDVRGSNYCDLYVHKDDRTHRLIVVSAIDNLVKGAAGQAVHNMNIMLGLDQTTGLLTVPLNP